MARCTWRGALLVGLLVVSSAQTLLALRGTQTQPQTRARTQEKEEDRALAQVQQVVRSAQSTLARYRRAGGEAGGVEHPGAAWAQRLWALREEYPGGDAAAMATSESIRLWGQAEEWEEVSARVRSLEIEDGAWRRVFTVLEDQFRTTGDSSLLLEQGQRALGQWRDADRRVGLHSLLGRVAQSEGDLVAARVHYQAVLEEAPESEIAAEAEGHLYELDWLQPGQTAPIFEGRARDGRDVSLASLGGHPVLILFWASW